MFLFMDIDRPRVDIIAHPALRLGYPTFRLAERIEMAGLIAARVTSDLGTIISSPGTCLFREIQHSILAISGRTSDYRPSQFP